MSAPQQELDPALQGLLGKAAANMDVSHLIDSEGELTKEPAELDWHELAVVIGAAGPSSAAVKTAERETCRRVRQLPKSSRPDMPVRYHTVPHASLGIVVMRTRNGDAVEYYAIVR